MPCSASRGSQQPEIDPAALTKHVVSTVFDVPSIDSTVAVFVACSNLVTRPVSTWQTAQHLAQRHRPRAAARWTRPPPRQNGW